MAGKWKIYKSSLSENRDASNSCFYFSENAIQRKRRLSTVVLLKDEESTIVLVSMKMSIVASV